MKKKLLLLALIMLVIIPNICAIHIPLHTNLLLTCNDGNTKNWGENCSGNGGIDYGEMIAYDWRSYRTNGDGIMSIWDYTSDQNWLAQTSFAFKYTYGATTSWKKMWDLSWAWDWNKFSDYNYSAWAHADDSQMDWNQNISVGEFSPAKFTYSLKNTSGYDLTDVKMFQIVHVNIAEIPDVNYTDGNGVEYTFSFADQNVLITEGAGDYVAYIANQKLGLNYQDLKDNNFTITDLFGGTLCYISDEFPCDWYGFIVGFTKNNGNFPNNATVYIDPYTTYDDFEDQDYDPMWEVSVASSNGGTYSAEEMDTGALDINTQSTIAGATTTADVNLVAKDSAALKYSEFPLQGVTYIKLDWWYSNTGGPESVNMEALAKIGLTDTTDLNKIILWQDSLAFNGTDPASSAIKTDTNTFQIVLSDSNVATIYVAGVNLGSNDISGLDTANLKPWFEVFSRGWSTTNYSPLGTIDAELQVIDMNYWGGSAPDVNINIPNFPIYISQYTGGYDHSFTIDFNVMDSDFNALADYNATISYFDENQTTQNIIITDLNLFVIGVCSDTNFTSSARCTYDWNISLIPDGNYIIDINVSDGDNIGNDRGDYNFSIDNTPPVTIATDWNGEWQLTDANIHFSASDANSAVTSTRYRINGGDWFTYDANIYLSYGGLIDINSTDLAGNIEDTNSWIVYIDKAAPTITYWFPDVNTTSTIEANVTFIIELTDSNSTPAACDYNKVKNAGIETGLSGTDDVNADNFCEISYTGLSDGDTVFLIVYARDNVGNIGDFNQSFSYTYDTGGGGGDDGSPGGGGLPPSPPVDDEEPSFIPSLIEIDVSTKVLSLSENEIKSYTMVILNLTNSDLPITVEPSDNLSPFLTRKEFSSPIKANDFIRVVYNVKVGSVDYNALLTDGNISGFFIINVANGQDIIKQELILEPASPNILLNFLGTQVFSFITVGMIIAGAVVFWIVNRILNRR